MKKLVPVLTISFVAFAAISCWPFSFKPSSADPVIELDKAQVDFGAIPATDVVQEVVKVTNRGGKTLEISRIQTSCGCTAGVMDSQTVKPGGSSRIKITFDPRGKHGRQARTLWIFSNDPKNPQQQLTVISDIMALTPVQQPQIQVTPTGTATGGAINIPQPSVQTRSVPEPAQGLPDPAANPAPATTPAPAGK